MGNYKKNFGSKEVLNKIQVTPEKAECYLTGREIDLKQTSDYHLDHVVPRSKGGRTIWQNVVTACPHCNLMKGNRLPHEVGMHPKHRPTQPNSRQLQEVGRRFPPNYLHGGWRDYLYWDTELDPW